MKIDKETFEKYVPAFASPTEDLFLRISGFIAEVLEDLIIMVGDSWESVMDKPRFSSLAEKYVCRAAAYKAVPYLDLVATETGFGVVSNQNVAPASAHRVNNLREDLRIGKSVAIDLLLDFLMKNSDWGSSDEAKETVEALVWCPTVARACGITTIEGATVYQEEFETLLPDLMAAEAHLRELISPELYDALIARICTNKLEAPYTTMIVPARHYIAFKQCNGSMATVWMKRILDLLDKHADSLPEYKESATYRARHSDNYQNKKEDGCFFFG